MINAMVIFLINYTFIGLK